MIRYSATPDFIAAEDNFDHWDHWGLLISCIAVTGLVTVFLFFIGRQTEQIEKSAGDISNINAKLKPEMMERQEALAKIKLLTGLLPICASCKKIQDDKGDWSGVETYVSEHTDAVFSHGLCPECEKKGQEDLDQLIRKNS